MRASDEKLSEALLAVGLVKMARSARASYYNDLFSLHPTPALQLMRDLDAAMGYTPDARQKELIALLIERHKKGDFDHTAAEAVEFKNSPEGRRAKRKLAEGN